MMNGHEKSGPVIVAVKPANKAERSGAELVEPRTGAKGNAEQVGTLRTPSRESVSNCLIAYGKRQRSSNGPMFVFATYPRWEPYAGKPHVRICAGGAQQCASLPRSRAPRNDEGHFWLGALAAPS
jgi:hypothetical protein